MSFRNIIRNPRILLLIAVIIVLLPPVLTTYLHNSSIPHPEQLRVFDKSIYAWFGQGGELIVELFQPRMQHVNAVPKMALLFTMTFFGVSFYHISVLSLLCTLGTVCCLVYLCNKTLRSTMDTIMYYVYLLFVITTGVYYMHFAHIHRILGFSFSIFFTVLAATLLFRSRSHFSIIAAFVACTLATWSCMFGIVSYVICIPMVLNGRLLVEARRIVIVFVGAFLLNGLVYLALIWPSLFGHIEEQGSSIGDVILFTLVVLGRPFALALTMDPEKYAALFGIVVVQALLAIFCFDVKYRNGLRSKIVWYCLALFGICSAVLAAIGRAGDTQNWSSMPRFLSFSCLVSIACLALYILHYRKWNGALSAWIALNIFGILSLSGSFEEMWIDRFTKLEVNQICSQKPQHPYCSAQFRQGAFLTVFPSVAAPKLATIDRNITFDTVAESIEGGMLRLRRSKNLVFLSGWIKDESCNTNIEVLYTTGSTRKIVMQSAPVVNIVNRFRTLRCDVPISSFWHTRVHYSLLEGGLNSSSIVEVWAYNPQSAIAKRIASLEIPPYGVHVQSDFLSE